MQANQSSPQSAGAPRRSVQFSCTSQIIIPARLRSTRLPQKLLLRETGKSLLQHTYESALRARLPQGITVAVDCQELYDEVTAFGGTAVMTDADLPSGTDRVAAAAAEMPDVDVIVNVQGDEPEIDGEAIDQLVCLLAARPAASVATLAAPIRSADRLENPACVKLVMDQGGKALYFSRSPIPHARSWDPALLRQNPPLFWQHIGIYAYRREFLMQLGALPVSPLEETEKLEQLRFLQAGCEIVVGQVEAAPKGIDTSDDYRAFVRRYIRDLPRARVA
ncbi:MAG: 3-deoxy-manno-octulosonate cytidylyltransferase [Planctomycetota bacterium]|nr:MAG: 3-deoxy-manno-octulosonate cytidylyltransferase [Planctomycetota bacterium]